VQQAVRLSLAQYTAQKIKEINHMYIPVITDSGARSMALYDKHVKAALEQLRKTSMYHPACEPPALQTSDDLNVVANTLGCLARRCDLALIQEYFSYRISRGFLSAEDQALGHFFWYKPEVIAKYPGLSRIGQWYGQLPTSPVALERFFDILRTMESHQRMPMEREAFVLELMLRSNKFVLEHAEQKI
jgi:hypothetical protein